MTKTKYLLYSLKLNTNGKYTYWYETDNKYFKEKKPPKHILDNINLEVDILEENKIQEDTLPIIEASSFSSSKDTNINLTDRVSIINSSESTYTINFETTTPSGLILTTSSINTTEIGTYYVKISVDKYALEKAIEINVYDKLLTDEDVDCEPMNTIVQDIEIRKSVKNCLYIEKTEDSLMIKFNDIVYFQKEGDTIIRDSNNILTEECIGQINNIFNQLEGCYIETC